MVPVTALWCSYRAAAHGGSHLSRLHFPHSHSLSFSHFYFPRFRLCKLIASPRRPSPEGCCTLACTTKNTADRRSRDVLSHCYIRQQSFPSLSNLLKNNSISSGICLFPRLRSNHTMYAKRRF